jgi:hypothetical protein
VRADDLIPQIVEGLPQEHLVWSHGEHDTLLPGRLGETTIDKTANEVLQGGRSGFSSRLGTRAKRFQPNDERNNAKTRAATCGGVPGRSSQGRPTQR